MPELRGTGGINKRLGAQEQGIPKTKRNETGCAKLRRFRGRDLDGADVPAKCAID